MTEDHTHDTDVGFAPHDPSDGRKKGDWTSRYRDSPAISEIRLETGYLLVLFFLTVVLGLLVWIGVPGLLLEFDESQTMEFNPFAYGVLGGLFGGTLFCMKWLYHSVARGLWHMDRRLWRCLTPLISAGLAAVTVLLIGSGLLAVFNEAAIRSGGTTFAIGFLVGYFSDSAIGKFAEIANTIFGSASRSTDNDTHRGQT